MKIAIVGAGALGCVFGGGLSRLEDHETTLIDVDRSLVETLREKGVILVEGDQEVGPIPVRATTEPAEVGVCDLVLFVVKTFHSAAAAELAQPLVGPDTVVATIQNGLGGADALGAAFRPEQVVYGVTYQGGTVLEPGRVRHHSEAATEVGPWRGDDLGGAQRLADLFGEAGWEARAVTAVGPKVWKKLMMNCMGNAVAALTGMSAGQMADDQRILELQRGIATEAVAVAGALGFQLDLDEVLEGNYQIMRRSGKGRPSMLQDVEAGRRTEIDALNGAIAREGDAAGIETPLNDALTALVKAWETAHLGAAV
jgi:2-dehydropantoate 2-reductase